MRNIKKKVKPIHQSIEGVVCLLPGVLVSLRFSNQSINQSIHQGPLRLLLWRTVLEYFIFGDSLFIRVQSHLVIKNAKSWGGFVRYNEVLE
jgi:hypothetical protein